MIKFGYIDGERQTNSALTRVAKRANQFWNFRKRNSVPKREKERLDELTLRETAPEEIESRWNARRSQWRSNYFSMISV